MLISYMSLLYATYYLTYSGLRNAYVPVLPGSDLDSEPNFFEGVFKVSYWLLRSRHREMELQLPFIRKYSVNFKSQWIHCTAIIEIIIKTRGLTAQARLKSTCVLPPYCSYGRKHYTVYSRSGQISDRYF